MCNPLLRPVQVSRLLWVVAMGGCYGWLLWVDADRCLQSDVAPGSSLQVASLSIRAGTPALALTIDAADTIWLVDGANTLRGYAAATASLTAAVPLAAQGTGSAPGVAIARTGLAIVAIDGIGITAVGR